MSCDMKTQFAGAEENHFVFFSFQSHLDTNEIKTFKAHGKAAA